jgi:protein O-mannosyl-transferase
MSSPSRVDPDRAVLAGVLLATAVYCQDIRYDFLLDDVPLVLMNDRTASWHNVKAAFMTHIFSARAGDVPLDNQAVHYRPVYILWQMMNRWLFGAVLPWWHLTSLLLHIGVTVLVYFLGVQILRERWPAALGALLFALHPIHAESVSYVSASTDLLVTLFLLISFLSYVRFREGSASLGYLVASVVGASLAMLSKETAAVFPLMLVAYESLREGNADTRHQWKRFVWSLPFVAVVAAYAIARTLLFGLRAGPGPGDSRSAPLLDAPLVLLVYVRNLLWSFRLSFFYPVEWSSHWTVARGCGIGLIAAVAAFLWKYSRGRPGLRLLLSWTAILFLIPIASISAFVREDWVHDRHMYLVSVPFCLVAAALLTNPKFPVKVTVAACTLTLAALFVGTAVQVPRFSNGVAIYASALKVDPNSTLVRDDYARALWSDGRHEEALREFQITTELWPRSSFAHDSYGASLAESGRDDEAAAEFAAALRWSANPNLFRAQILSELATNELKHFDFAHAAEHLREALRIAPQELNYTSCSLRR